MAYLVLKQAQLSLVEDVGVETNGNAIDQPLHGPKRLGVGRSGQCFVGCWFGLHTIWLRKQGLCNQDFQKFGVPKKNIIVYLHRNGLPLSCKGRMRTEGNQSEPIEHRLMGKGMERNWTIENLFNQEEVHIMIKTSKPLILVVLSRTLILLLYQLIS